MIADLEKENSTLVYIKINTSRDTKLTINKLTN